MTVQLLSPAGSVRRHGERATVEFPGLADDDQEALPRHQPTLPKELGEGALPPYVEQEPADAASTVEDGESDALAPPEPAVAEPAPPITGDALDKVDVTGNLVPVVPPEML